MDVGEVGRQDEDLQLVADLAGERQAFRLVLDRLLVPPLHLLEKAEVDERSDNFGLVADLAALGECLLEEEECLDVVAQDGVDIADVREAA